MPGSAVAELVVSTAEVDWPRVERELERRRAELTGYCYRMLGSPFEAEDAVQETLMRAWRSFDRFEGRSSLRSWLYRIATNVCFDMLRDKQRRALPVDIAEPGVADGQVPAALPEATWLLPIPTHRAVPGTVGGDPGDVAAANDTIRLAFVAALQHLPPLQRTVLILRDVLRWKATEVAELLDTTAFAVKSALQRARATMASRPVDPPSAAGLDDTQAALLAKFVDAFQRYDVDRLVGLLRDDATLSMPPVPLWLLGTAEIRRWFLGEGEQCRASVLIPIAANGAPAFAHYRKSGATHEAFAVSVLDVQDGEIAALDFFVDTRLFTLFGLPLRTGE